MMTSIHIRVTAEHPIVLAAKCMMEARQKSTRVSPMQARQSIRKAAIGMGRSTMTTMKTTAMKTMVMKTMGMVILRQMDLVIHFA